MPTYQQMGHHSENLLFEPNLIGFAGAVLSPVNYDESATVDQVTRCRAELGDFDLILDPQLYYPNTERGVLADWSYFPEDVDTADLSSDGWWESTNIDLVTAVERLEVDAICSPVVVPRTFSDDFYLRSVRVGDGLDSRLSGSSTRVLLTALVDPSTLAESGRAQAVASVLSRSELDEVYLVVVGATEPRRELRDAEEIKGVMALISALEQAGMRVLVAFSSSDVVLWKAAGARSCSSGKFFNLRRFTASRFEEPSGGGGQLPYWLEEALLAFLRESDLLRVLAEGMLSPASLENPFGVEILSNLESDPGRAWLGLAWRQYLYWFADIERRCQEGLVHAETLTRDAESKWLALEDAGVLMEEPRNDGQWLRPWRRALSEFER